MAQSSTIVNGQELMLFMDGASIAFATSHTLSVTGNTQEISSKDHGFFTASKVSSITWEITAENLYTDAGYNKLFNAMVNNHATPVTVVFGHYADDASTALAGIADTATESWTAPSGNTTVYYTGSAYITSLSVNAANSDNATFSITLSGVGKLEQKNYTA